MNAISRNFAARDAVREAVPLFISLTGPSSSGKTFSGLSIGEGIQKVTGGDIHLIDTENRRGLHYADRFRYKHVQFDPPFGSLDYLAAMEQSVKAGAGVIIVDSASLEHEGPGGMLDFQDQELRRLAGDDYGTWKAERFNMLAWQKPKMHRRQLIAGLVRLNAAIIFCFRAKETSRPIKDENGKTKIVPMGFTPISGDEWIFEMGLGALLMPGSRGVPTWESDNPGERMAIKLPEQFAWLKSMAGPLNSEVGVRLAEWARGEPPVDEATVKAAAIAAAKAGKFDDWWKAASPAERSVARKHQDEIKRHKTAKETPPVESPPSGGPEDAGAPASASSNPVDEARQLGRQHGREGRALRAMPAALKEPGREPEALAYRDGHAEGMTESAQ